jgi:hypothetical protein
MAAKTDHAIPLAWENTGDKPARTRPPIVAANSNAASIVMILGRRDLTVDSPIMDCAKVFP